MKDYHDILNDKFLELRSLGCFISVLDATDLEDHGTIIADNTLQVRSIRSPRFATMAHGQADQGRAYLATHLR